MTENEALCFDMYGTLCDTGSVTATLGEELGVTDKVVLAVDELWRQKQLQYATEVSLMESYEPFWDVTERALEYALAFYDLDATESEQDRIVGAYEHLDPYPDAVEAVERLGDAGYAVTVLSNGNPEMLATLAENAGLAPHLDDVISAHEVRTFKPAPAVYRNAADRLDRSPGSCRLVSSNAWDVAGASDAGMGTVWVNRAREPPERIGGDADVTAESLAALAETLS